MKTCSKCKQIKELDAFTKVHSYSEERRCHCKDCCRQKTKNWRQANPRKAINHTLKYQRGNPEKTKLAIKKYQLKKKFNITIEQYKEILLTQDKTCAICHKVCASGRWLAVDHNHKTGQNRGLLCARCNVGLGHFLEDKTLLASAIKYMDKYEKN